MKFSGRAFGRVWKHERELYLLFDKRWSQSPGLGLLKGPKWPLCPVAGIPHVPRHMAHPFHSFSTLLEQGQCSGHQPLPWDRGNLRGNPVHCRTRKQLLPWHTTACGVETERGNVLSKSTEVLWPHGCKSSPTSTSESTSDPKKRKNT